MKLWGILFLIILCNPSYCQISIDDIDLELIRYKKIRSFISEQHKYNVEKITDIHHTCSDKSDLSTYQKQEKKYLIKDNYSKVWSNYVKTSPAESWEGKLVSFGMLISKSTNKIIYPGDEFQAIDTGQVIFLDLRLLRGIYHLAMAFEVIKVDAEKGIIEFSYIKGNKSMGMQRLQFSSTPNDYTVITHSSYYKSSSPLRDKLLYPLFHAQATNQFHRKLKRKLKYQSYSAMK